MSKKNKKDKKKEVVELSNQEKVQIENKEKQELREQLVKLKEQNQELKDQIFDMNEELRIENLLNTQVYKKLVQQEGTAQKNYAEHQQLLEELKVQYQKDINEQIERNSQFIQNKQEYYEEQEFSKQKQIEDENKKLAEHNENSKKEKEYLKTLDDLQMKYNHLFLSHHESMRDKEKNFYKEKNSMDKIFKSKIDDYYKNAFSIAQERIKEVEEDIKKKNIELFNELNVHQKAIQVLKEQKMSIQKEHQHIKRELQLNEDELNEYDELCVIQKKKIHHLKEKLKYIRQFISNEVQNYTKEIEIEKIQQKERDDQVQLHIQQQSQAFCQENIKYQKAKILAKTVLEQRAIIENFFIDSLEKLKNMMLSKNREDVSGTNLKQKSSTQQIIQDSSFGRSKIDLDELELEEKEKIFRVLFYKINQGKKKKNWSKTIQIKEQEIQKKDDMDEFLNRLSKDDQ